MVNNLKFQKILKLADIAKNKVEDEIRLHNLGKGTIGTMYQLNYFLKEIECIIQEVSSQNIPHLEKRRNFGRVIADDSSYDNSELGDFLLELQQAYRGLKI